MAEQGRKGAFSADGREWNGKRKKVKNFYLFSCLGAGLAALSFIVWLFVPCISLFAGGTRSLFNYIGDYLIVSYDPVTLQIEPSFLGEWLQSDCLWNGLVGLLAVKAFRQICFFSFLVMVAVTAAIFVACLINAFFTYGRWKTAERKSEGGVLAQRKERPTEKSGFLEKYVFVPLVVLILLSIVLAGAAFPYLFAVWRSRLAGAEIFIFPLIVAALFFAAGCFFSIYGEAYRGRNGLGAYTSAE